MEEKREIKTIDDYILSCSEIIQPKLKELRKIISNAAPEMTEKISWRMPAFCLNKNVIQFAAFKNHIGIYPGPAVIEELAERLKGYKTSKGAIQIPNDMPLDRALIEDIVEFNIKKMRVGKVVI